MKIPSPEGRVGPRAISLAASPSVLAGKRLAVLDNGKPGAALLMNRMAQGLADRTGVELVGSRRKRTAATPCEDALIAELAEAADLVLTGSAD